MTLPEALRTRIVIGDAGCWLWCGPTNVQGYGMTSPRFGISRSGLVHRVVYELLIGPIPGGLTLDHLCRVRRCCNPEHLEPAALWENTFRGESPSAINARKTECKRGHPFDAENTYFNANGDRSCRTCERARDAVGLFVRVPAEVHAAFKRAAEANGVSMADVLRQAAEAYIASAHQEVT